MAAVVSAEDSAEKLKYDVRKQVQEALDISEALQSLQRSLTSEISRRQRAEEEKVVVQQRLAVLKERAKQLGELIKREKETRRTIPEYTTDSDEEEEEEDNLNETEDDDDDLSSLMSMIDSSGGGSAGAGAGARGSAGVRGDRLGHQAGSATAGATAAASSSASGSSNGDGAAGRGSSVLPGGGRPSAIAAANRRGFAAAPSARGGGRGGAIPGARSAQTFQRAHPRIEMPDLEMQLILAEIQGATPNEIQERVFHALPFVAASRAAVSPAAVTIRGAMALPVFPQFKPESETQKQLRADEQRYEKQFKTHMALLRDWLKREHARIEAQVRTHCQRRVTADD